MQPNGVTVMVRVGDVVISRSYKLFSFGHLLSTHDIATELPAPRRGKYGDFSATVAGKTDDTMFIHIGFGCPVHQR